MSLKLNQNFGFDKNPFSKLSAEEELGFHQEIFYKPNFYNTLLEDLLSGTSRFILGKRGHGKSSVIYKLKSDLSDKQVLTVIIDRYDEIPLKDNKIELLNELLAQVVSAFVIFLDKNPTLIKKMDKSEKETLSIVTELFFKSISSEEFKKKYESVKNIRRKNR